MNNLIIAVIAWWIAEGSGLMQKAIHWLVMKGYRKTNRLKPLDCPLCLAFWIGLGYTLNPIDAILCSSMAILISKVYVRL
jgi:hypothetical protein